MSKLRLAVSVGSFLCVLLVVPALAQDKFTDSDSIQQAPSVLPGDPQKLPDEEMARLYLVRKQYREAQDIFHRLTVEHPGSAVYWNELGISFHSQSDVTDALKCYEKSAKLDKHYPDPLNNMGTVYYARKKYPKAIRAYKHALAMKEDFAPFYLNLGYAYFGDKQYDQSIASFRKALQIDPEAFDNAKSHSGTVIQDRSISMDRARFYFLLAKSFAESGNAERCALYLKKARDEGYQDMKSVNTDSAFAKVVNDQAVQDVLAPRPEDMTTDQQQQQQ
jgi:tetratricopeptide (TPR) repeat protein